MGEKAYCCGKGYTEVCGSRERMGENEKGRYKKRTVESARRMRGTVENKRN